MMQPPTHSLLNWGVFLLAMANAWINNILACNSRPRAGAIGSSLGKLEGTLIYCHGRAEDETEGDHDQISEKQRKHYISPLS